MHTVLRSTVGRVLVALALVAGAAGALTAPALASAPSVTGPAHGHSAPTTVQTGSSEVEIGTAVAYERQPDGSIRRVR
jgi:hypothetical protein